MDHGIVGIDGGMRKFCELVGGNGHCANCGRHHAIAAMWRARLYAIAIVGIWRALQLVVGKCGNLNLINFLPKSMVW